MTIQIYKARIAYTSHTRITAEQERAIEASNYCEIPEYINVRGVKVPIYNESGYAPDAIEYYDDWERKVSGWCHHKETGLKVKIEKNASPNYYKKNGNETCDITLKVKLP